MSARHSEAGHRHASAVPPRDAAARRGPAVELADLTATHLRHPAVHHVSRALRGRQPGGDRRAERRGKTTLLRAHRRAAPGG
jgi:hypothetical protein